MISKELLSEVLGYPKNIPYGNEGKTYKLNIVSSPYINENGKPDDIYFQTDAPGLGVNLINVYKLAHKCRLWAYKQGFLIGSNCRQGITVIDIDTHTVLNHFDVDIEDFTEFEIKACQWILEGTYMQTTKLT